MSDEDKELFDSALSDVQPAEQPETPQPEASERPRDEQGRFAPKEGQGEAEKPALKPAVTVEPERAQEPEPGNRIPLAEFLNERERRQQFEREAAESKREREALQRQIEELRQAQQPKQELPDLISDPDGYRSHMETTVDQRMRALEANFSFRLAHKEYKQEFEAAYDALDKERMRGNIAAVRQIMTSSDPGEAMVRWHRQNSLFEKTGGDLDKFLSTHTEKLLDDEAFLAKAAEKIRARSNGGQQRPATTVQLPPSLSRVTSAAPVLADGDDDESDAALLRNALKR